MKILFLQFWYDMYGGAETVNHTLANQFKSDGYEVKIECMYKCGNKEIIPDIDYEKTCISLEPKRPSYKVMLKELVKLKIKDFNNDLKNCIKCRKNKFTSIKVLKNDINSFDPDWIIITNPEIVKYVPKNYLKKCLIHIHSGCEEYFTNSKLKKTKKILFKYENKIYKLIWLTKGFMEEGKKYGLKNSEYMYNPVRFKSDKVSTLDNNNITFIGRIAPVKRVYLLSKIFNEMNNKNWNLNIYGSGRDKDIVKSKNIRLLGPTGKVKDVLLNSSVFALTSSSEGFPMVVLESYECGVPVIAFDFKVSSHEVIKNNETGFIIPMDNKDEYIKKLKLLCNDSNLRKDMGKKAKEYAKKFYPEEVSKRWYKLFRGEL